MLFIKSRFKLWSIANFKSFLFFMLKLLLRSGWWRLFLNYGGSVNLPAALVYKLLFFVLMDAVHIDTIILPACHSFYFYVTTFVLSKLRFFTFSTAVELLSWNIFWIFVHFYNCLENSENSFVSPVFIVLNCSVLRCRFMSSIQLEEINWVIKSKYSPSADSELIK